jgi:hypothetical protein
VITSSSHWHALGEDAGLVASSGSGKWKDILNSQARNRGARGIRVNAHSVTHERSRPSGSSFHSDRQRLTGGGFQMAVPARSRCVMGLWSALSLRLSSPRPVSKASNVRNESSVLTSSNGSRSSSSDRTGRIYSVDRELSISVLGTFQRIRHDWLRLKFKSLWNNFLRRVRTSSI